MTAVAAPTEAGPRARLVTLMQADLRVVALHEHGHAVMAQHHGVSARVVIAPNPSWCRGWPELFWTGDCVVGSHSVGAYASRRIGLAGACAVALDGDLDVSAPVIAERVLHARGRPGLMPSPSDLAMADGFTPQDLLDTTVLMRGLWPQLLQIVDEELARWQDHIAAMTALVSCEPATTGAAW